MGGLTKELHVLTLAADGSIEGAKITKVIDNVESRYLLYVNNYESSHAQCETNYWEGPAKAAGWNPPCGAASAARRRRRLVEKNMEVSVRATGRKNVVHDYSDD